MKYERGAKYQLVCIQDASNKTCGKIIAAHTIQRSRVLRSITNSKNKVLTFYPPEPKIDGTLKLHEKGWKQASIFSGFCKNHDDGTFSDLEKTDFTGSKKEIFLIAYRAVCWELYQKIKAVKSYPAKRDLIDRGTDEYVQLNRQYKNLIQYYGHQEGLNDFLYLKKEMDKVLISWNLSEFSSYEIILKGPVSVVSTGAISPNHLLNEKRIQVLHDTTKRAQLVAFGVDIHRNSVSVIFFWYKLDKASQAFIDDIKNLSNKKLTEFLVQFFFAFCENTYFSDSWWNGLNTVQQEHLKKLSTNPNPYYLLPNFDFSMGISPWSFISKKLA